MKSNDTMDREGIRHAILEHLKWNDRNGSYTDEDRAAEGWEPLSLEEALVQMVREYARDSEFMQVAMQGVLAECMCDQLEQSITEIKASKQEGSQS